MAQLPMTAQRGVVVIDTPFPSDAPRQEECHAQVPVHRQPKRRDERMASLSYWS